MCVCSTPPSISKPGGDPTPVYKGPSPNGVGASSSLQPAPLPAPVYKGPSPNGEVHGPPSPAHVSTKLGPPEEPAAPLKATNGASQDMVSERFPGCCRDPDPLGDRAASFFLLRGVTPLCLYQQFCPCLQVNPACRYAQGWAARTAATAEGTECAVPRGVADGAEWRLGDCWAAKCGTFPLPVPAPLFPPPLPCLPLVTFLPLGSL